MITFSALDRVIHCPLSAMLPTTPDTSDHARAGTARHAYLEALGNGATPDAALLVVPEEHRGMCAEIETEGLPLGPPYQHEVALALDPRNATARVLGQGLNRQYPPLLPGEICGTADVVRIDDFVEAHDFKGDHNKALEPASTSLQLRAAALCGCIKSGASSALVSHIHIRDDGTHWQDGPHEVGILDMLDDARRITNALDVVASGVKTDPVSGAWCRYCPARLACPESVTTFAALTVQTTGVVPIEAELMRRIREDPEGARAAVARAASIIGAMTGQLKAYAEECGGWQTASGQWYGKHVVDRSEIDGVVAFGVALDAYGEEVARAAVSMESSAAAIERAAKKAKEILGRTDAVAAGEFKVAPAKRALLAEVEKRGGIITKKQNRTEEHRR